MKNKISGGSSENLTTAEAEGGEPLPPASPTSLSPPAAHAESMAGMVLVNPDSNASSIIVAIREASTSQPRGEPEAAGGEDALLEAARAGAEACERWDARENAEA